MGLLSVGGESAHQYTWSPRIPDDTTPAVGTQTQSAILWEIKALHTLSTLLNVLLTMLWQTPIYSIWRSYVRYAKSCQSTPPARHFTDLAERP
jgi:hypothetical protein